METQVRQWLKIATIELNTPDVDMSTLLDTAFEIIVSD